MCSDSKLIKYDKYHAILSFDVVCVGLPVIIMLEKVNKQVQGKLCNFKFIL